MVRRLTPTQRITCASPDYLEQHGTPSSPKDLRNHFGLVSRNLPETIYWQYTDAVGNKTIGRPATRITANNGDILVSAAIAGLGICAVPLFISHTGIQSGELVPILTDYTLQAGAIYAVYPSGRYRSNRVRVLIDFLVNALSNAPYRQLQPDR